MVVQVHASSLGLSPEAICNLNGGSFVQDALVTARGWQYVAYYQDTVPGIRHVHLGRRKLPQGDWQVFSFGDYEQTEDDGHNIISLGICEADGTLHLSWDAHDTPLRYRHSLRDLISDPDTAFWHPTSFSAPLNYLPGLELLHKPDYFEDVTYPRFLSLDSGALAFEFRVGISGLGNDLLFIYSGSTANSSWSKRGVYLQGVKNNAYINGIDSDSRGTLHATWTYRDYVPVTMEQSRQQAGPNGPENNHDLCYAYSPSEEDGSGPGLRWFAADGRQIATSEEQPILPSTPGILAFDIPKYSGILNQEAQAVDLSGNVHVLNRELVGELEHWFHYSLMNQQWSRRPLPILPLSQTSARGKLLVSPQMSKLHFLLPLQDHLAILSASSFAGEAEWETVATIQGAGGEKGMEPLFDRYRLTRGDGVLSLFLGVEIEGEGSRREVKVIDLQL
ncbi:hypothetical protein BCR35DRAFT_295883 [Leucosporidium creatinivorum]|uniref:Dockerin type 1 n=1 Tax=Leucosporidium creatinivorum TaxID=106004 RepID=A0A1Y2DGH0_9BASI|nr:hypothetical protein BCR35DRAFT_295883 [Leucosporidium creatinivorum]